MTSFAAISGTNFKTVTFKFSFSKVQTQRNLTAKPAEAPKGTRPIATSRNSPNFHFIGRHTPSPSRSLRVRQIYERTFGRTERR